MASNLQASSMQLTIEDLPVIQDALTPSVLYLEAR